MLTAEKPHPAFVPAATATATAAAAAVLLQISALAALAPEGVAEALWVLGWSFAAWAALAGVAAVVMLCRRSDGPVTSTGAAVALLGAAVLLLAITAWLHPFAGSGGGVG